MSDISIEIRNLGKKYILFNNQREKIFKSLGLQKLCFWKKNRYNEFWALRGVDLQVKKGERLGIIGRNGAGKSTLLKIITGNLSPTEGEVSVHGHVQALMELGTGFHPDFTGRENIRTSLAYNNITGKKAGEMEAEIIDFAEIDEFIDQPVRTYSAGMYARLAFSVATAVKSEILIIDEILGAGDAYFSGKCVERMKKLTCEDGVTVLFVSHDAQSVQALCSRVIWVDKGQIIAEGDPLDIIKQYTSRMRKEDEIRLKARDIRVSKTSAKNLEIQSDVCDIWLFHFIGSGNSHPEGIHNIRKIRLIFGNSIVGEIDVGAPFDNHPEHLHYLMDDPGLMDWDIPKWDKNGHYRSIGSFGGKYSHAPFVFSVPKNLTNTVDCCLEIEGNSEREGGISLELFNAIEGKYFLISSSDSLNSFSRLFFSPFNHETSLIDEENVKIGKNEEEKNPHKLSDVDQYGSQREIKINSVRIFNADLIETKILTTQKKFSIEIEYQAYNIITNPVFVFCIYLPSGECVSQWISTSRDLGLDVISGKGSVIFEHDCLFLGCGSYVASAAIFRRMPLSGEEPPSYHVMDRCIHFVVVDENPVQRINFGICRQPIHMSIKK